MTAISKIIVALVVINFNKKFVSSLAPRRESSLKGFRVGKPKIQSGLVILRAESPEQAAKRRGERRGFYMRPSAAIEKGGGFFIPGLEGERLRVFVSLAVLGLLALNRFPGYDAAVSQLVSESIGALAATALLIQATSAFNFVEDPSDKV